MSMQKLCKAIWLILPVIGGSLIGPLSNFVTAEKIHLKCFWRYLPSFIYFGIYLFVKHKTKAKNEDD